MNEPSLIAIADPAPLLSWLESSPGATFRLGAVEVMQTWGLVALATLGRHSRLAVDFSGGSDPGRFAAALNLPEALRGERGFRGGESGRTIKLTCFRDFTENERLASEVSRLILPDPQREETRRTLYYVMVELLRNVIQHSQDPLGGVIGAQLMNAGRGGYESERIQVAVGDAGIGIPESLRANYPEASDPQVGLERAIWPHVSSAFEPGLSGNQHNAGLGLFFLAEMAKLTAGRLVVASRGATLVLEGADDGGDPKRFSFLPTGFQGTLVVFELGRVEDYEGLIKVITDRARERTPARVIHRWLRFEDPPPNATRIVVAVAAEDTAAAVAYARNVLEPRIVRREPIALDFINLPLCTQSFLHALLFQPLRLAWALHTEIYILNARPAVRSTLQLLESYALGG